MATTEQETMTESEFVDELREALDLAATDGDLDVRSSSTFDEAGLLTSNEGLVVRLGDGSEFQVTVVRSR